MECSDIEWGLGQYLRPIWQSGAYDPCRLLYLLPEQDVAVR